MRQAGWAAIITGIATIPEALAAAVEHHRAGRLQAAEQACRQVLEAEPQHAEAWHLRGLVQYQLGQHQAAAEYLGWAIRLNPHAAAYHCNLGLVYQDP